jgi:Na+-driven multidrug efflux pump
METTDSQVTLKDFIVFYLPLIATGMLMMSTHSLISNAVARTANPTPALAGYSAAYSVGALFNSINYGVGRMMLTFTQGKDSFARVFKMAMLCIFAIIALFTLVSITPLSKTILHDILNLRGDTFDCAVASFSVLMFWTLADGIRQIFQSRIIRERKTIWFTINMIIRVSVMFLLSSILPRLLPTGPVGALLLIAGVGTEGLLALFVSLKVLPKLEPDENPDTDLRPLTLLSFALPLAFASMAQNAGKPIIAGSLSRMSQPDVTLAGYQVALSFSFIFLSVTYNIYQAVVIFVKGPESFGRVRQYSVGLGLIFTILLAFFTLPPVGRWVFGEIIQTGPDVTPEAVKTLTFLALTPAIASVAEFYDGILMLNRQAKWVTAAKLANVGMSSIAVLILAKAFPTMGGSAGSLALVVGTLAEAVTAYWAVRSIPECRRYFEKRSVERNIAS